MIRPSYEKRMKQAVSIKLPSLEFNACEFPVSLEEVVSGGIAGVRGHEMREFEGDDLFRNRGSSLHFES